MKKINMSHSLNDDKTILVKDHISHEETFVEVFDYAVHKLHDPWYKTLLFGIMAGFFVALAYIVVIVALAGFIERVNGVVRIKENIPPGVIALITGLTFTPAILMIIFIGGSLLTSNSLTLLPIIKRQAKLRNMMLNLLIVLVGNLIGTLIGAVATYLMGHIGTKSFYDVFEYIYIKKYNGLGFNWWTFLNNFVSAIMCNFLIAGLFWMSIAVKNSATKVLLSFFIIFAFGISGFQHIVANGYIWTTGLFLKNGNTGANFGWFIIVNLLPTLMGNFIGGGLLLPIVYLTVFNKRINAEIKANRFTKIR